MSEENYLYTVITYFLKNLCKRYSVKYPDPQKSFLLAVLANDLKKIKDIYNYENQLPLEEGLIYASQKGYTEIVQFLADNGASNLDDGLKESCLSNFSGTAELLVQKGANPRVGLRNSSSPNITRMLYRYLQNTEVIN